MNRNITGNGLSVDIENKRERQVRGVKQAPLPISIVIISYNSREDLRACLTSMEAEPWSEVIVVDNVSSDGSDEIVTQEFPKMRLIRSNHNNGYGAAANLGIASCSSKYVLLLNSDTLLQWGTLQSLTDYLDRHPQVAVVGPSIVNPDGIRQASCFPFPTPWQILLRETSLAKIWSENGANHFPDSARAVPWVLGAALAIRRQAFTSVGGFDQSFFMYYEEVDLCYRLNKAGWQTHFTPAATVTHIGGASTKQKRTAMAIQLYKSLCHFYKQHHSRVRRFQLKLVLTYLMLRNILKETFTVDRRSTSDNVSHTMEDLMVWRSVLSSVWSTNGWLKP
jgi:GT2 family glycosyltransferase